MLQSLVPDVQRGVVVGVVGVGAVLAAEDRLALAVPFGDVPALVAGLGRVWCRYADEQRSGGSACLVVEHVDEPSDARLCERAVESAFRRSPVGQPVSGV